MAACLMVATATSMGALSAAAQDEEPVYVVEVTGVIDRGLAPYLARILNQAEEEGGAVLLHIDTPGGRLDAVLEMRRSLLETDARTIAFVDANALSAGALVALASDQIHIAPGGVIGAATPVTGQGETASEKTVSAVSGVFRSTAESQGRDPQIAAAMVDPDIEIPGLVAQGELLTLSAEQAIEVGLADAQVEDLEASLAEAGLSNAEVIPTSPSPAEQLVRWLTNPVVASLLLTVGIWLVIGDLLSGGVGIGLAIGLGLIASFLWGHQLAGLAGWEDIVLVVLGVVLIALEVFVIPGTGIAGILGLAALLGGAYMAMLDREVATGEQVQSAVTVVSASFLLIVVGMIGGVIYLQRGGGPRGLVLTDRLGAASQRGEGWTSLLGQSSADSAHGSGEPAGERSLVGATGVAITDLRPSGLADVDGRRVDVVTEGGYISSGEKVEVVADQGYRRVVRSVPPSG